MAKSSCDWTVERLPWWANRTLEEGEAERVAAHLEECAACRDELAATRQAMALYSAHLPIETLLDLAQDGAGEAAGGGEPGGVSRAAADVHLGHCAECRDELALLRESRAAVAADAEEESGKVTAFTTRRPAAAPGAGRRRRFDRRAVALAASVLVAVVAAGGWLSSHRAADERGERLAELRRQLEEVTAADPVPSLDPDAAPNDERPTPDPEAAIAARDEEIERLQGELARLQSELAAADDAGGPSESGERVAELAGPTTAWNLAPEVLRGAEQPEPEAVDAVEADEASHYFYFVTGGGDRPLRLIVEDGSGRKLVEARAASVYDVEGLGRHVTFAVPLAGLPEVPLRVRVLAEGEEVGRRLLRVNR